MGESIKENLSLKHICRNLNRNESGIWISERSNQCHYPEDGAQRLATLEEDSFWFTHRRNCIVEMVRQFPPEGMVIDVGGGNGFVTLGLQNAGFNAILLEPGESAVLNAHQRGLKHIIQSTIENVDFDKHSVPAVGLFDVLEHIEDDIAFLNQLRSILKCKALLYLTVPAFQCLWSLEDHYAEHFRRYRLKQLSTKLDGCGFEVQYATYLFSYLIGPLLFVKVIPTKLGLAKIYTHEQTRNEHIVQSDFKKGVLDSLNGWEQRRIRNRKVIPFGTSIMLTARMKLI